MLNVTSWWKEQVASPNVTLERELVFYSSQGSGYNLTPFITKWPSIKRRVNEFKASDVQFDISLATLDSRYGWLTGSDDNNLFTGKWQIRAGFTHAMSGPEMPVTFLGRLVGKEIADGRVKLSLRNGGTKLTESVVWNVSGSGTNIPVIIGSNDVTSWATPGLIAWTLCTCYAGMDATQTAANTEINYPSVQSWTYSFTGYNVSGQTTGRLHSTLNANGEKASAILSELVEQAHSIAWISGDGRLAFRRRNGIGTAVFTLSPRVLIEASYQQADDSAPTVAAATSVPNAYTGRVTSTNCTAYAVFGKLEKEYSAGAVGVAEGFMADWKWYFAPNITLSFPDQIRRPYTAEFTMGPSGVMLDLGDEITAIDTVNNVSSYHWLVTEHAWDLQDNAVKLKAVEVLPWYALDFGRFAPGGGVPVGSAGLSPAAVYSLGSVPGVSTTAPTSGQVLGHDGTSYWIPLTPAGGTSASSRTLLAYFNASPTNVADSNAAGTKHFGFNNNRHIHIADLSIYTQVRFGIQRSSASATTAYEMELVACNTFATDITSYWQISVTSRCALICTTPSQFYQTGWLTLASSAIGQGVYLGIMAQSGDGAADPNFGMVYAEFKA